MSWRRHTEALLSCRVETTDPSSAALSKQSHKIRCSQTAASQVESQPVQRLLTGWLRHAQTCSTESCRCRYTANPVAIKHCVCRAESSRGGGFASGFVVGGVVFGTLGFLFAPQISRAILGQDQKLRLPKFLEEEEKSPEATKQDLADKIAQLNSAIDDVSSQLKSSDAVEEPFCCMSRRVPSTTRNSVVASGLIAFISLAAAFPFLLARTGPTVDSSKPLSGQAVVRGAYINSGSKDIGPDPTRYDSKHGIGGELSMHTLGLHTNTCQPFLYVQATRFTHNQAFS
ncbi:hypothetical protein ABBQ32_006839 [Trebouxia sp. C0010 RCD-2024]